MPGITRLLTKLGYLTFKGIARCAVPRTNVPEVFGIPKLESILLSSLLCVGSLDVRTCCGGASLVLCL